MTSDEKKFPTFKISELIQEMFDGPNTYDRIEWRWFVDGYLHEDELESDINRDRKIAIAAMKFLQRKLLKEKIYFSLRQSLPPAKSRPE